MYGVLCFSVFFHVPSSPSSLTLIFVLQIFFFCFQLLSRLCAVEKGKSEEEARRIPFSDVLLNLCSLFFFREKWVIV